MPCFPKPAVVVDLAVVAVKAGVLVVDCALAVKRDAVNGDLQWCVACFLVQYCAIRSLGSCLQLDFLDVSFASVQLNVPLLSKAPLKPQVRKVFGASHYTMLTLRSFPRYFIVISRRTELIPTFVAHRLLIEGARTVERLA